MLELKRFEDSDLDAVFAIQQAAFKPLYETYQDQQNPYHETKERILLKHRRSGTLGYLFLHDKKPVGAVRVNFYQRPIVQESLPWQSFQIIKVRELHSGPWQ